MIVVHDPEIGEKGEKVKGFRKLNCSTDISFLDKQILLRVSE